MNYFESLTAGHVPEKEIGQFECKVHGLTDHYYFGTSPKFCRKCEAESKAKTKQENLDKIYARYKSIMTNCGINADGKRFDDWQFDDAQADRQEKIVKTLSGIGDKFAIRGIDGRNAKLPNIMLVGGTGSGKTMLANALAKNIYRRAVQQDVKREVDYTMSGTHCVRLITSRDITEQAKATWGDYQKNENQLIEDLANFELLIIDDLGDNDTASNEEMAANDRGRIAQIIAKRYQKKPTIITTNLTPEQVVAHLGDRAWDRLQENLIIIKCDWASYRQSVAKVAYL